MPDQQIPDWAQEPIPDWAQEKPRYVGQEKPKRNYTLGEVPGNALMNAIPSLQNYGAGMYTAVTHPRETALLASDAVEGAMMLMTGVRSDLTPEQMQDAQRKMTVAKSVYDLFVKERYGGWEALKRTVAEDPVGVVADFSSAGFAAPSAAIRAGGALVKAGGKAQKLVGLDDAVAMQAAERWKALSQKLNNPLKWKNRGLKYTLGLVHPNALTFPMYAVDLPVQAIGFGAKHGYNALMDPTGNQLRKAMGTKGDEIQHALESPGEIVTGSTPTAAEVAAPAGSAGFSSMLREPLDQLDTTVRDKYAARDAERNTARIEQIRSQMGSYPGNKQMFESARQMTTDPLYATAKAKTIVIKQRVRGGGTRLTPEWKELMSSPVFQDAVKGAERNLRSEFSSIYDTQGRLTGTGVREIKAQINKIISDLDNPINPSTAKKDSYRAALTTKTKFQDWAYRNIPELKIADKKYAEMSVPINKAEIGEYLENLLIPKLGESTERRFIAGFQDAPKTIKKGTGEARFKTYEKLGLSKQQIAKLEDIVKEFQRIEKVEELATYGKGPVAAKAGSEVLGVTAIPQWLDRYVTIINRIIKIGGGSINRSVATELALANLDPAQMAKLVKAANARPKDLLNRAGRVAGRAGRIGSRIIHTPSVYNVLSPRGEEYRENALRQGYTER